MDKNEVINKRSHDNVKHHQSTVYPDSLASPLQDSLEEEKQESDEEDTLEEDISNFSVCMERMKMQSRILQMERPKRPERKVSTFN